MAAYDLLGFDCFLVVWSENEFSLLLMSYINYICSEKTLKNAMIQDNKDKITGVIKLSDKIWELQVSRVRIE